MKKLSSFTISIIIHVIIFAILFLSYKTIKKIFDNKKEEKIISIKLDNYIVEKKELLTKKIIKKEKQVKKPKKKKSRKKKKVEKKTKNSKKIPKKVIKKEVKKEKKKNIKKITKTTNKKIKQKQNKIPSTKPVEKKPMPTPKITKNTIHVKKENYQKTYIDKNLSKIRKLIEENIYYPRKARRKHIEGEVILKFCITKNGEIEKLNVVSSSSDILTHAAKQVIIMIENQLPKPKEDITITIPLNYRLH